MYKDKFIQAIHDKRRIRITFLSKEDHRSLTRKCAPMDYGPSRRAKDKVNRFHVWDYESDQQQHTLGLKEEQIISMEILEETFRPEEFVTWATEWFVARDWGQYS